VLPFVPSGDSVKFYFTYNDSLGNQVQEPATGYYSFSGGTNIVNSVSDTLPTSSQDILSNSYPNPFYPMHQKMTIEFYSQNAQSARIIIMNGLGQKVKTLFNGMAQSGSNTVSWNGKSDNGMPCSSGVYFYMLSIGGHNYSNKLLLLK
ncbi:MAG TPA: FlgD immunoglobulin-like domain containing protein, partial [Ignavibacteriaceae bacterium]|nr:FlgD immunoglobulin-like domain containing protein [Ignavibacteriaceae bacterium]